EQFLDPFKVISDPSDDFVAELTKFVGGHIATDRRCRFLLNYGHPIFCAFGIAAFSDCTSLRLFGLAPLRLCVRYKPFTTRVIPFLINSTLKLMRSPSRLSVSRKYVSTCFLCTGATASTDLISTITLFSTIRSARKPRSILIVSWITGIPCCRLNRNPRLRNS